MAQSVAFTVEQTDTANSPTFEDFYRAYDRAFVLPDEKESRAGLAECLALNHAPRRAGLAARYGAFRELCLVIRDGDSGEMVGGANFIALPHPGGAVSANLNYIFLVPEQRGKRRFRAMFETVRQHIAAQFPAPQGSPAEVLVFIEQNDPLLLSDEDYRRDTDLTGLDQIDRLRIWSRLGAKLVDFPYVQPPLSAEQDPDDGLVYSVLGASGATLEPAVLARHLRGFFGISVLKGQAIEQIPVAHHQLALLDEMAARGKSIALIALDDHFDALAGARHKAHLALPLRDWLAQAR